jgi:presenilin-like A22 family membrane protease
MKHNIRVTIIILAMFLVTQFIGLYVINQYAPIQKQVFNNQTGSFENQTFFPENNKLPFGMQPPEEIEKETSLLSFLISFAIAIALIFLLIRYKFKTIIKIWFFAVVIIALTISINAFLKSFLTSAWIVAIAFAIPLAILKVFRPNVISHNFTEILIYPGIAAVFIPLLNYWSAIVLLVIISIYDMWAVWHSGIMQKMAKYQMEEVGVFGGFFIPSLSKKVRAQIRAMKAKKLKRKFKVSLAILGGGDVVFPLIAAGVFFRTFGIAPALFIIFGAFAGLTYLLINSEKKKVYPAMPFITAGVFAGLILWLIFAFL